MARLPELDLQIVVVDPPAGVLYALRRGATELTHPQRAGDAELVYHVPVTVRGDSGAYDFGGPYAAGPKGGRFVYLRIGKLAGDPDSPWERALKVTLVPVRQDQIAEALSSSERILTARVAGKGKKGGPACASVPLIGGGWTVEPPLR